MQARGTAKEEARVAATIVSRGVQWTADFRLKALLLSGKLVVATGREYKSFRTQAHSGCVTMTPTVTSRRRSFGRQARGTQTPVKCSRASGYTQARKEFEVPPRHQGMHTI